MYEVKSKIFLEFTKAQKSALCNYLRALIKKLPDFSVNETVIKFFDDEKYYLEINASRFEFLKDFIDNETFISEVKLYMKECKKYYEYKKSQAPLIQAQKEFEKKKKKFLQEIKMSKELPTKKQLSYYKSLCQRYNIKNKSQENNDLSKLDLKNLIEKILDEHKTD